MAEVQPIIVFHGRHFVRHLGICNPICVKLLHVMSGVISSKLKKTTSLSQTVLPAEIQKRGIHTDTHTDTNTHTHTHIHTHTHKHTHTHTHDDSIRRIAMRCISPKNQVSYVCWTCRTYLKKNRLTTTSTNRPSTSLLQYSTSYIQHDYWALILFNYFISVYLVK